MPDKPKEYIPPEHTCIYSKWMLYSKTEHYRYCLVQFCTTMEIKASAKA